MVEARNPFEAIFSDALKEALATVLEKVAEQVQPEETGPLGLSITQAAELLGVSRDCMTQLVRREDFPAVKIGGRYLISRDGLKDWLAKECGGGSRAG